MGKNYWPYGYLGAVPELQTACRYSIEQHLARRAVTPDELFCPELLDT